MGESQILRCIDHERLFRLHTIRVILFPKQNTGYRVRNANAQGMLCREKRLVAGLGLCHQEAEQTAATVKGL